MRSSLSRRDRGPATGVADPDKLLSARSLTPIHNHVTNNNSGQVVLNAPGIRCAPESNGSEVCEYTEQEIQECLM
jgi:hypothetical protein